ncbi:MAG TPA: hypothetical protein VGM90_01235 [Kofleriaceae bacterium]
MKRMIYFQRTSDRRLARMGQDGATIYVLHPDDDKNILTIPHSDADAAAETWMKIRREHFHSRIGFVVDDELEGCDTSSWIPRFTPEQEARHALEAQIRANGYLVMDGRMAMRVYNEQERYAEIVAATKQASSLHCVLSVEDNVDVTRRPQLLKDLAGALSPTVEELIFEAPWQAGTELASKPLKLPPALLDRRTLKRISAIGANVWPSNVLPTSLTHVRLWSNFDTSVLEQLVQLPKLRVLQVMVPQKVEAAALDLLPGLGLDELTVYNVDPCALIRAFAAAPRRPKRLRVAGAAKQAELVAAVECWPGDRSTLEVAAHYLDEATRQAIAATGVGCDTNLSPFFGGDYTPAHKALLDPFIAWNQRRPPGY